MAHMDEGDNNNDSNIDREDCSAKTGLMYRAEGVNMKHFIVRPPSFSFRNARCGEGSSSLAAIMGKAR
jgi:hypothetical protein